MEIQFKTNGNSSETQRKFNSRSMKIQFNTNENSIQDQ